MLPPSNTKPRGTLKQRLEVFFTQALEWGMSHRTPPKKFENATRLIIIAATLLSTAAPHADTITDPMDPDANYIVEKVLDSGTQITILIDNNSNIDPGYNMVSCIFEVDGLVSIDAISDTDYSAQFRPANTTIDSDGDGHPGVDFGNGPAPHIVVYSPFHFVLEVSHAPIAVTYTTSYRGRADGHAVIRSTGAGTFAGPVASILPVPLELNFATTASSAIEGITPALTASLNAQTAVDITFDVAITGGEATAPDYTLTQTSFTIPKGASSVDIPIQLTDSDGYEGPEDLELTLQNASATLGTDTTHTLTIVDMDIPATVWVDPQAATNGIGTLASPLNDLLQGITVVGTGGTINIYPGNLPLSTTINKALTLQAVTTNVRIGAPAK